MKISSGLGGRGSHVEMSSKQHPASHFQTDEVRVKQADDGSFVIHRHMSLKKKHEGRDGFHGGYKEPEMSTAQSHAEMMKTVGKHFGKMKEAATDAAEPMETEGE